MKKQIIAVLFLLGALLPARAQVEQFYLEGRGSYISTFTDNHYQGRFEAEYVNMVLKGKIVPSVSYFWRQRFTLPLYNASVPLNATDQIWIQWQATPRWAFQAGKIPIFVGSFEFDDLPIDLYYWNTFCNNLPQYYALGAGVWFTIQDGQKLHWQITQSPLQMGRPNRFHSALVWMGSFTPSWETLWSVNWADEDTHSGVTWLALGNRFTVGSLAFELDLMYRTTLGQWKPAADLSVVLKAEYTLEKWKFFAKGGADYNDTGTDPVIPTGTRYFYGGGGAEWFPLGNEDLRLHAVALMENRTKSPQILLGVTYRFRIVK